MAKATQKQEAPGRKELLRQAYGTASQELREEHRGEFNERYAAAAQRLGVDWSPRPSEEQRAEQQFEQLLTDYPHLRERIAEEPAEG